MISWSTRVQCLERLSHIMGRTNYPAERNTMKIPLYITLPALLLVLAACSGSDEPAGETGVAAKSGAEPGKAAAAPEPDLALGKAVVAVAATEPPSAWNRCVICHTIDNGAANRLGPNLWGSYGSKAAHTAGFHYTSALRESGLTWDDATLHAWLENPRKLIPGNRMNFPGLKDPAQRQEIIDYLKAHR